ncbi:ABC-2 transporter permease [uncultured Flavonifractor sp.]|uniref:ABC-2 transporter permease n=1 Tax=uncultured Flavonifractor sp. TaxID=1193534 RepID=UPI00260ECB1D|nr:ABC-2 transporter permease [uncultured Flavonifractor sp.]
MKGLIYKDILAMRRLAGTYLLFFLVYGGLAIAGVFDISVLGGMVVLLGMMIPMSSISMDDTNGWARFAVASPVGRQGIIKGKYLFTLLTLAISTVLAGLLMAAATLLGIGENSPIDCLLITLCCTGAGLLLDAVLLPLTFQFGTEKARILNVIFFAVLFGSMVLLGGAASHNLSLLQPPAWLLAALPVLFALVSIGGFAISYCISQSIYAKKEF